MSEAAFTIIDEGRVSQVTATVRDGSVLVSPQAMHAALRWELKPQGLCKDDHCIPVADQRDLVTEDGIELAALAERLSRPLAIDLEERVACMGASAAARSAQLASLEAPDFTLPDLAGHMHSLSDYRGKKVLLVAYASW